MKKLTLIVTPIIIIFLNLFIPSAMAWKPYTHVFLAEEVLSDIEDDNKITMYTVNNEAGTKDEFGKYEVSPDLLNAIKKHGAQFRAGVLGPDAYPDILTGQQSIHPYDQVEDRKSNDWLKYLWEKSLEPQTITPEIRAFVAGFLVHAAGDMFGHTFINHFTGGEFKAGPNALEHIVLEGYIGKRTPKVKSYEISIKGVKDFIYNYMIKASPESHLMTKLLVGNGSKTSLPYLFSSLRNKLQVEIDNYDNGLRVFRVKINKLEQAYASSKFGSKKALSTISDITKERIKMAYYMEEIDYKKKWIKDIDDGLNAWPTFNHELAEVLTFGPNAMDLQKAIDLQKTYVTRHLLTMAGLPDAAGMLAETVVSIINTVISALNIPQIESHINRMKDDLLSYMLKETTGYTAVELKKYLNNPEQYFDKVMNNPRDGAGERISLHKCNTEVLHLEDNGYSNMNEPFKYDRVPALYNTVVMTKLIFMSPSEINRLLRELGSPDRLIQKQPNAMLGFIRSLDSDNQWHENPVKMVFATSADVYKEIFFTQTGEKEHKPPPYDPTPPGIPNGITIHGPGDPMTHIQPLHPNDSPH